MGTFKKFFYDWIIPILIALVLYFVITNYLFFKIYVPTESMKPAIMPGDRIIATRIHDFSKLKRGDIIVFKSDELNLKLVKRLIGLPKDKIVINNKGELFVNGEKLNEPYVIYNEGKEASFEVPENHYLFLGDNRASSNDARYWENPYIPKDKIMGKASFIIYPFNRVGKLK
ncbi:signal peptidase [Fervidicella metallireducens AeB]|uniref:Signal peptidase I n=1 Tax=Fervidicella metallireducens AeB TaxID=1403537 RepID=A0A017RXQ6_9CLOT|nr:signal peptidase I [Fervidicella metallireducens]EYE89371.1 signal peptidase [Fervidicella metallireducens AeB]